MTHAHKQAKVRVRKRAANLSIDAMLLDKARALGIGVSGLLEEGLRVRIREEEGRLWLEENRDSISAMNRETNKRGVWNKRLRRF